MTDSKPGRFRFSTDDLAPGERFAVWNEGFVHRKMDMEFVDLSSDGLRFTIEFVQLGGVAAGIIRGTPSVFIRKPGDGNETLYMVINRKGRFRVVQQSRPYDLAIGDAAVMDNRCAGELHSLDEGETWSISMPRDALRHLVRGIEENVERFVPASNSSLRLLVGYLETLFALDEIEQADLAGVHIADMVASALGPRQDAQAQIEERGVRAARLRAVLDAIGRGTSDPDVDPAGVAEQLGMSVRYLHRLLEETGKTFSEHVLGRRLERVHRLLRDPRLARRRISDIALETGFTDLSHFNRSFRRAFGETPSEARAAAARKENE